MASIVTEMSEQIDEEGKDGGLQGPSAFSASFYQRRKKGALREVEPPHLAAPAVDTHAHLDNLEDPGANLARCAIHGVEFVCAMADAVEDPDTTYLSLDAWLDRARGLLVEAQSDRRVPHVRVAVGCHPHNAKDFTDDVERALRIRLADERTCALGEVGLDYHYDLSPRDTQRAVFRRQIRLAKEFGLPLVLHVREAHDDALSIMREEGFPEEGTLLHCCGLAAAELMPWVEAGCFIAYGGALTFKKSEEVRSASLLVPRSRLLTETDSPYMAPEPMRGTVCGPEHVIFTAACLTRVFGCSEPADQAALLDEVRANAYGLLDREPTPAQRAAHRLMKGTTCLPG